MISPMARRGTVRLQLYDCVHPHSAAAPPALQPVSTLCARSGGQDVRVDGVSRDAAHFSRKALVRLVGVVAVEGQWRSLIDTARSWPTN
jgi:hypothetical protein